MKPLDQDSPCPRGITMSYIDASVVLTMYYLVVVLFFCEPLVSFRSELLFLNAPLFCFRVISNLGSLPSYYSRYRRLSFVLIAAQFLLFLAISSYRLLYACSYLLLAVSSYC